MKTYCFLLFALALFIQCCYCDTNYNHEAESHMVRRPSIISKNAPKVQNFLFKIIKIFAQAIKSLPHNARNRKVSEKTSCPLVNSTQSRINDLDSSSELTSEENPNIHMRFGNGHDSLGSNGELNDQIDGKSKEVHKSVYDPHSSDLQKNLSEPSFKDHPVHVDSYGISKDNYLHYDHSRDPIKKHHVHNGHLRGHSKGRHGNKQYSSRKYHLPSDHSNYNDDHSYNIHPHYSSKDHYLHQKPLHSSLKVHREHTVPMHSTKAYPSHSDFSHVLKDHHLNFDLPRDPSKGHRFNKHHRHYSSEEEDDYFHIRPLHTSLDDQPVHTDLAKPIKIDPVHIDLSHGVPKKDRLHVEPNVKHTIKIHPMHPNSHISKDYDLNHDHLENLPRDHDLYKEHSHGKWEKHYLQKPHLHDSSLEKSEDPHSGKYYLPDLSKDLYKDVDQFHDHPGYNLHKISSNHAIKNHPIHGNLDITTHDNVHHDYALIPAKSHHLPKYHSDQSDHSNIGTRLRNSHSQDQHLYKHIPREPLKDHQLYNDHSRDYTVIFHLPKDRSHDSPRDRHVPKTHVYEPSKEHRFGTDNLKGHLSHLEPIRTSFKDHPVVVDFADPIKLNPIHVDLPSLTFGPSMEHQLPHEHSKVQLPRLEPVRTSFKDHPVAVDLRDSINVKPIHLDFLHGISRDRDLYEDQLHDFPKNYRLNDKYSNGHLPRLEPVRTSIGDHSVVDFADSIKVDPIDVDLPLLSGPENDQLLNVDRSHGHSKCKHSRKNHSHKSAIASARLLDANSQDLSRSHASKDYVRDPLKDHLVIGNSNDHLSNLEPVLASFKDHSVVVSLPDSIKVNPIHVNVPDLSYGPSKEYHQLQISKNYPVVVDLTDSIKVNPLHLDLHSHPKNHNLNIDQSRDLSDITHNPSKDHDLYEDHTHDSTIDVRLYNDLPRDSPKVHLPKVHVHHPSNHYSFGTDNLKEHIPHLAPLRTSFKDHPVVVDFTDSIKVNPIHIHLSDLSYGSLKEHSKEDLHTVPNDHLSQGNVNDDLSYVEPVHTSIKDHPDVGDLTDSNKDNSIHLEIPQDTPKNYHLHIDQTHDVYDDDHLQNNQTDDSSKKHNLDEDSSYDSTVGVDPITLDDYLHDSSKDQPLSEDDIHNLNITSNDYQDIPSQESTIDVTIRVLNSHDHSKDHPVHNDHSEHSTIDIRLLNENSDDLSNEQQLQKSTRGRHSHKPCPHRSSKHHLSNDQSEDSIIDVRLHNDHSQDDEYLSKGHTYKSAVDHHVHNDYSHDYDSSKEHHMSNDHSRDFTVIVRLPNDHSDDSSKSHSLYKGHTQQSSKDHLGVDSSIGHLPHLEPVRTSFKDHPVVLDLADSIKVNPLHLDHLNHKSSIGHLSHLEPVQTSFKNHPVVLDLTDSIKVDPVHVNLPSPSEDHHSHTDQSHDISKSLHLNHKYPHVPSNDHHLQNTPSYNSPKDYHSHVGHSHSSKDHQLQYLHNPSKGHHAPRKPSRGSSKGHRSHKNSRNPSRSHYLHRKYSRNPSKSRRLHHEQSHGYSKAHQPHIGQLNELPKNQHASLIKSTVQNLPKDLHINQKVHHAVKNYPLH